MRVTLTAKDGDGAAVQRLAGRLRVPLDGRYLLRYRSRTGALLRVDGEVAGAFDREHASMRAALTAGEHEVALDVERRSLPTSGLPAGPGPRWRLMLATAAQRPRRSMDVAFDAEPTPAHAALAPVVGEIVALVGHAHLDVAWLWTYAETRRKAARTFAIAAELCRQHRSFVFTQSQPQLYTWVEEDEPELFSRVQELIRAGRFDASGAAMWVEPDCNLPSGESLLRQLSSGIRYTESELGVRPTVAWLPDSFGFASTLPTLLCHAGVHNFATTKLRWNDTTAFPHPRFVWRGPDGSSVLAALFAAYEGDVGARRIALARSRDEPLVVGHSDGGGGPTEAMVSGAPPHGRWTTLDAWFRRAGSGRDALPTVSDELYLQYHRGVFTTHHDVKARNAALERALERAELALSWAAVLRASPFLIDEGRRDLAEAWRIVSRAQFHDVLPGTSVSAVYRDVFADYDRADALVRRVMDAARASLPRAAAVRGDSPVRPTAQRGGIVLENWIVRARLRDDGAFDVLTLFDEPNVVEAANVLAAYGDRPSKWEAWNIDAGYERRPVRVETLGVEVEDEEVFIRYRVGRSYAAARVSLREWEPFVRVELAIDWRERRTLLRSENRLILGEPRAFFGSPHGFVERPADPRTDADRAKFEACGQRFGRVEGRRGSGAAGVAVLALDTYGWNVASGSDGAVRLGHSLLRGTTWPDEHADAGEHRIDLGFMPTGAHPHAAIEAAWRRFALPDDGIPPLFSCDDPALLVVATKPADDGDGIVVRVRECDGAARDAEIACAARPTACASVDALERPLAHDDAVLAGVAIRVRFGPFGLRSFRVRFS